MDIFLAQMFGIYFVIVGAIVLMRRKALLPAIDGLQQDRALMMIIGAIELVAGIGLALAYPVVSLSPVGLLSLVGYIMAIEGILYLGGGAFMQKIIRRFNSKRSFILGGIVSIVLGLYLLNYGFALL
jgi:uncharacterized membrane protein HdeD (DUF308 family)